MIERILEPEVMESPDEAIAYDEMDHRDVNLSFVEDYVKAISENACDILDIGTGTARIPIELCKQLENIRIMAVDLSLSMLDVAKVNVEIAGLTERIKLDVADSKKLLFEDHFFDAVISNSIIHHIPDPSFVFKESVRVVRPDGYLFFRDLKRPNSLNAVDELVAKYASDESDDARQMFYNSLCAALSVDEVRSLVHDLGFQAETIIETSDRHWTWVAQRK